jgi:alpha-galactosidase
MGDSWTTMVRIAARNGSLRRYAGAGGWNDPDELEVGNGGMTTTEYRTHFSLWSIMAAPLLAGTDVRSMSRPIRAILTNREAIAIDQDPLGVPGARHRITATRDVWLKPLAGGARALLIVNRGGEARTIRVPARLLGASRGVRFRLRDVWAHRTQDAGAISALVDAHDVAMYRVGVLPPARPRSRG